MTREESIKIVKEFINGTCLHLVDQEALKTLIPELKESKGEIHEWILEYLYDGLRKSDEQFKGQFKSAIDWLENLGNMDIETYKNAEKEKSDFVGDGFIKCYANFLDFKEGETYWLEYVGKDNYNVRSDNLLGKTYHITPYQLYRLFTQEHCPKEDSASEGTNAPTGYGKYVDECLNKASKHFFSEGEDKYSVADLFYAGVRCGKSWLEKQGEQELKDKSKFKENSEYERVRKAIVTLIKDLQHYSTNYAGVDPADMLAWLENHNPSFKQISDGIKWDSGLRTGIELGKKEQKPSINIDQLKSMMLQYLQEAANEKDDSAIEADTDKWARMILRYDFEQKPSEWEWPNLSNCIRNCKKCHGKCLYRKEPYEEKQPLEWSEEDVKRIKQLIYDTEAIRAGYERKKEQLGECFNESLIKDCDEQVAWLKSLKDRGNFPKSNTNSPSEWSEEDKHRCKDAIYFLETAKKHYASTSEIELTIEWLKSLQPQARQEQKEQTTLEYLPKEKINDIISKLTNLSFRKLIPYNSKEYKKIKEIRTNVRDLLDYPIEQKPVEWSEEDEKMRTKILEALDAYADHVQYTGFWVNSELIRKELMGWLKSLHPQPHTVSIKNANKFAELEYERGVKDGLNHHWKPSEEQMQALSETIAVTVDTFPPKCTLITLRDDLNKLMEE